VKLERSDATVAGVEEPCGRAFAPSFLLSGLDPSLREGHPRLAMPLPTRAVGRRCPVSILGYFGSKEKRFRRLCSASARARLPLFNQSRMLKLPHPEIWERRV
jgi:hypothetical protein